jgi:MFS family permease
MKAAAERGAGYLLVSLCYWAFTLSDGALRMLVLLHLHAHGQTPLALALLLLPYEAAGVFTNLLGGYFAGSKGEKPVLVLGLLLQVLACLLLSVDTAWLTLPYVMLTQVLSGVAKDLAKTAAKSYVRVLVPDGEQGPLYRMVAFLTGSKNAMKGLGFFAGGACLAALGFAGTNLVIAGLLLGMALLAARLLPAAARRPKKPLQALFAHHSAVHWLAAARLFLFASRDAWFAVALPLYLGQQLGYGAAGTGAYLSVWVIGYGVLQAAAPRLWRVQTLAAGLRAAAITSLLLLLPLAYTHASLGVSEGGGRVLLGLLAYGALFAITSSLHSWLVVGLAGSEDTAERVGYYYAANAAGRLGGVLVSGWLYGRAADAVAGLGDTLLCAGGMAAVAGLLLLPARAPQAAGGAAG